jgi:uncharacterized protein (TIGR02996 family)
MTDDEAFVRAIVAAPGDDLPRLVYADWLDDRGDPRGAYLRAEAEGAKAQDWASAKKLNRTAEGLDSVWVARVSRPPFGVCCERLRFENAGPPLSPSDVESAERETGLPFPPDLTALLLNYNGGRPGPGRYRHPIFPEAWCDLQPWVGVTGADEQNTLAGRVREFRLFGLPVLRRLIPLGTADEGGYDWLAVDTRSRRPGRVLHLADVGHTEFPPSVSVLANSLPVFLALLEREPAPTARRRSR